jgi:hypothetical protein
VTSGYYHTVNHPHGIPGADELPDDWQPPRPPPTIEELVRAEGQWLWFACYALLVHSGILPRDGSEPRRQIPETPGKLLDYADELVAFCRKTDRVKGAAIFDVDAVERRCSTLRWLLAGRPE